MKDTAQRFLEKFEKSDGCWNWKASKDMHGYGRFRDGLKKVGAHRFSYEYHVGEIPTGLFVMHSCDNPACVNPSHLSVGTPLDNMIDKCQKNRQAKGEKITRGRNYKGEKHPSSRFTNEQALAVLSDKRTHAEIAKDYGVSRGAISHMKRGFTWPHLHA